LKYKTHLWVLDKELSHYEIFNDLSVIVNQNQDGFEVLPTIEALKDDYSRVKQKFTGKERGDITH